MGCKRNDACLNIANKKYPSYRNEINNDIKEINNNLLEIESSLKGINIPDDYIGEKTYESINHILSYFEKDKEESLSIKTDINSFINEKIKEHKRHYDDWQREQEKKDEEKESENGSNK